jgi:hypothetical protein
MSNNNIIPFPGSSANAAITASTASGGGAGGAGNSSGAAPGGGNSGGSGPSSDPQAWTRQQVWMIRYHKKFNEDQKRRILHNFVSTQENRKTPNGAFLRTADKRAFLLEGRLCRLYRIDEKDPEFCGYMLQAYGLNISESITRHLVSSLKYGTIAAGLHREVRRFAHWDRAERTLWISRYDGTCYQINGQEVVIRPNGYGPAVFLDDDGGYNCDVPQKTGPEVGNHHELFKRLIDDLQYVPTRAGGMSPATQKTCLGIWLFTVAFPDLMPTKPLLLVEGEMGSGKTFALQRIAMTLHGKYAPLTVPKKEDPDFGVKILRSPIAIIDDVNDPVEWLRDTLCTYVTGGKWSRRMLFSDDKEHVIKPEAFLSITTNNPQTFRQGQVADRCLILKLERRADKAGYTPANQLFEQATYWRPELQGEWLYWLNEIVRELQRPQQMTSSKYRMADFAHLAHLIGRVLNQPAGPPGDWTPEAIEEMLAAMQSERDALVTEGDMTIELIDKWLDTSSNQGREIKIADLHRELGALAKLTNTVYFFKSPKGLAGRLREAGGALDQHFKLERRSGPGNTTLYTFRRT